MFKTDVIYDVVKMKKHLFTICLFIVFTVFLPAQTAVRIEKLLEIKAVSYEQTAQLVLEAAGILGYATPIQAFRYADKWRLLYRNTKAVPGNNASLEGISFLIMQSFELKGGIMYSLFQTPHYAYRELVYQNIIQGRADPKMNVSGDLLLFLVNRVLSRKEEGLL